MVRFVGLFVTLVGSIFGDGEEEDDDEEEDEGLGESEESGVIYDDENVAFLQKVSSREVVSGSKLSAQKSEKFAYFWPIFET